MVWLLLPLVLYHAWLGWHDGQMLLPLIFCVTGVIVTYWCLMLLFGRCCAKCCLTTLQLLHKANRLLMADVTAIDNCVRLMLLPYWDNVVWLMFFPGGWCYCHMIAVHVWLVLLPRWLMENAHHMGVVADVIAKVADGMATGSMF